MATPVNIKGRVVSGTRRAAGFTQLAWVQDQCREKLGFGPFPGTLNVKVSPGDHVRIASALREAGVDLTHPDSSCCAARALPLQVGPVSGALVLPAAEARIHRREIVEAMAPVCLREFLGLRDGDEIALRLGRPDPQGGDAYEGPGVRLRGGGEDFILKGLIFDLDGTLIDSIPSYLRIVAQVTERLGLPPVPRERIAEAMQDGRFAWERILPSATEAQQEALNARAAAIVREVAPALFRETVVLLPGVDRLLKSVARRGVRMGIATSTGRAYLAIKLLALKKAGLEGLLHTVITADDVVRPKPAPDPLIACAGKMGVAVADCLYCGDMRVDIRAGRAAGMVTVGVLTGFDTYRSLESVHPHLIVEDAAALAERLIP